jgi:PAS domain S-box-containing protein
MPETRAALARREEELRRSHALLDAIAETQALFIRDAHPNELFDAVLATLLRITGSGYGFVGEVLHDAEGAPYLRTFTLTNIAWDEETRALYNQCVQTGMEFRNLDTLFGVSLRTGETVISNDPANDPRSGGRPEGHPPLDSYLGLPVTAGNRMVGLIGLANRSGGYDQALVEYPDPLVRTCGQIIDAFRSERERQQAVEALRESEMRHKAVLDTAADAIITINQRGLIENFNPAAERIFGYAQVEVMGCNISMLMDSPHRESHDSYIANYLSTGQAKIIGIGREVSGRRKGGEMFPMELAIAEMHFGGQRHFSGIVRDISERKAAERLLHKTLALQDAILRGAGHAIISTDMAGTILTFNPAATRMLGYQPDELIGKSTPALLHEMEEIERRAAELSVELGRPVAPEFEVFVARALAGEVEEREWTYIRKDGSRLQALLVVSALRDAQGVPTGFLGIASDISERKQAQTQLTRLTSELQAILNLSPDGFVAFDEAGCLKYANPAFLEMCGCTGTEMTGMQERKFDDMLASMCESKQPYTSITAMDEDQPDILSRSKPHPVVARRSMRRLRDEQGNNLGRVVYFQDITQESELDRMKTEFLSTAAHELRTPLASIYGFSELLFKREFDVNTQRDMAQTIHRQSTSMVRLVNELLDLARIEAQAGKDFHIRAQPLLPIINNTLHHFMMPDDPRKVSLRLSSTLPDAAVDADKLEQALLNLLSNAYKYSPGGGVIVLKTLTRKRQGKIEIGITVRDHGIGMTTEQVEHVFERFYRANDSSAIPGAGLGMSLVKEIMNALQGTVDIDSVPNCGTTVTLWLPAV